MRKFDFYEFTGILVPGTLFLVGLIYLWPAMVAVGNLDEISIGGFGIFTLFAYVAGHLIQAVGNWVEKVWWKIIGGMPTDWIRTGKRTLLGSSQMKKLHGDIQSRLNLVLPENLADIPAGDWLGVTRQVYAVVEAKKCAGRVDMFNGNYGLHRGLAATALVLLALSPVSEVAEPVSCAILIVILALAASRMHLFGKHYARELFSQFLQLPP
ncbi:hypothetical protein [Georgfuchsia toluolica]|uniref:hypothetical protein n=1 Tax=Georgfuchsia toluolica TaxID=424218 RepID=UPI001C72FED3|nr:hypothetical protein [Georgfuchsia toluolica]